MWYTAFMTKALILVALLFTTAAQAEETANFVPTAEDWRWTTFDTVTEVAVATSIALDWNQTIRIGQACRESNPFLGPCPKRHTVNTYFTSFIVSHALVAYILPKPYRTFAQAFTLGMEVDAVFHNIRLGWRIRF